MMRGTAGTLRCPLLAATDNVRRGWLSFRLRILNHSSTFPRYDPARQFVKREISFVGECVSMQRFDIRRIGAVSIRPRLQESECGFHKFPGIHTGAKSVGAL